MSSKSNSFSCILNYILTLELKISKISKTKLKTQELNVKYKYKSIHYLFIDSLNGRTHFKIFILIPHFLLLFLILSTF